MVITSKITIDLRDKYVNTVVDAVQYDKNSRAIEVRISEGGLTPDISNDATFEVRFKRGDGATGAYSTLSDGTKAVTNPERGVLRVYLNDIVLNAPGMALISVCIKEDDQELNTFSFSVNVHKSVVQEGDLEKKYPDTYDATAESNNIEYGKTAYGNGEKVTGSLRKTGMFFADDTTVTYSSGSIDTETIIEDKQIFDSNASIMLSTPASEFGNAKPGDVAKGKTFTSASGLKVEGTMEGSSDVVLPDLTNPASAGDVASGKQFINEDGTVSTGSLKSISSVMGAYIVPSYNEGSSSISLEDTFSGNKIVRDGAVVRLSAELSEFGNANANQVTKGSTFTSAAGLLVEGTMEPSSGGVTLPTLNNPAAASDVAYGMEFIREDGVVDIGKLPFTTGLIGENRVPSYSEEDNGISMQMRFIERMIVEPDSVVKLIADASKFGNATANQVAKGATFTSSAGLKVEGTLVPDNGVELPELDNPGRAEDMVSGKQLIDADGNVVTGTIEHGRGYFFPVDGVTAEPEDGAVGFKHTFSEDSLYRTGDTIQLFYADLGDATAEAVVMGKTFTTGNGVKIEGTMKLDGQYCWQRYSVYKNYAVNTEDLGRTKPDDCGALTYSSYRTIDGKYFLLNDQSAALSGYILPNGKTNGATEYVYYSEYHVGYPAANSYYTYTKLTVGDTYTEEKGNLLTYVSSDDESMYPVDGIGSDGYWYVRMDADGITLPELDNPASASDVAYGKEFIGEDGTVVAGELRPSSFMIDTSIIPSYSKASAEISLKSTNTGRKILEDGAEIEFSADASEFGNASAGQVLRGTTFTSSAGLKVEGTLVPDNGVELPELDNPGSASDLAEGKQLIDGNGNVLEGTLKEEYFFQIADNVSIETDGGTIEMVAPITRDAIVRNGGYSRLIAWASKFGDARPEDVAQGVTFTSEAGFKVEGGMERLGTPLEENNPTFEIDGEGDFGIRFKLDKPKYLDGDVYLYHSAYDLFGTATPDQVAQGVTFTSRNGLKIEGTALIPGGGFAYPEGAFVPVSNFTDGKQYALVAVIDGVRRYINTTTYNNYTMNATQTTIAEDAGDYVIFSTEPVLFTAVASGDGFLLQNGANYLYGTSSGGTALRFGTTQAVWTVDASATGGFSEGKYHAKEDANAVWLKNVSGGYNWSVKYETAGSFGYDRDGRDNTYSTGFVSFILYEYVAGEGEISPVVDSSDANVMADKMLAGYSGYAKGRKIEGNIQLQTKTATANGTVTADEGHLLTSVMVNVPTGGSGGLSVKSGTTTSGTIETGLSDIEEFFLYKETQTSTGLIRLHYSKTDGTSYMHASAWATNNYGTKTITNATTAATVSGGSITIPGSSSDTGGLSSGVTYKWVAIGTE